MDRDFCLKRTWSFESADGEFVALMWVSEYHYTDCYEAGLHEDDTKEEKQN